jgi:hypothetical protein
MAIMVGKVGLFVSDCSPGNTMFSDPQFHDIILVAGIV